jgi:HAD superfamily hydrolase (TIGR01490 family)
VAPEAAGVSAGGAAAPALALFDLDGTLLVGDTDELWCAHLIDRGLLEPAFRARNAAVDAGYAAGTVSVADYVGFYCALLAGHGADWHALRDAFAAAVTTPRLAPRAHAAVDAHRARGDTVVLTTATNRFLAEAVAASFGFDAVIATELDVAADGTFTGRVAGTPNMRAGKVERARRWAAERGLDADAALAGATVYTDSANDLPLLLACGRPVAVDPEPRLAAEAAARGWPVLSLRG